MEEKIETAQLVTIGRMFIEKMMPLKEIEPAVFLHLPGKIVEAAWKSSNPLVEQMQKERVLAAIREEIELGRLLGATLISEVWVAPTEFPDIAQVLPARRHPDREDAVLLVAWGSEGRDEKVWMVKDRGLGDQLTDAKMQCWLDEVFEHSGWFARR